MDFRNIFNSKGKDDYTVIVGCGRLGAKLAETLSSEDKNVAIMDSQKSAFHRLSPNFGGLCIVGNGTDIDNLKKADISEASVVIAVTNDDNTNIMIAQIARNIYGVEHVLARLYDPEREMVYREFGIDTICPSALTVKEIEKFLKETVV